MLEKHVLTDACLQHLADFVKSPSEERAFRLNLYESRSWNRLTRSATTSGILGNSREASIFTTSIVIVLFLASGWSFKDLPWRGKNLDKTTYSSSTEYAIRHYFPWAHGKRDESYSATGERKGYRSRDVVITWSLGPAGFCARKGDIKLHEILDGGIDGRWMQCCCSLRLTLSARACNTVWKCFWGFSDCQRVVSFAWVNGYRL